jgi:hypothetical protein
MAPGVAVVDAQGKGAKMVRLPRVIAFLLLVWIPATAGFADVVVKYRVHADSITPPSRGAETCAAQAKRPKTGDIVTLTWSSDRARVDRPDTVSTPNHPVRWILFLRGDTS